MNTRIMIDSAINMRDSLVNRVSVVPITITFGAEEYLDGVTITHREFYEKLIECDTLPKTSQPSPDAFITAYEQAREAGDEVVVVTVSSKLSGTFQCASLTAQDYDNVYVVDSQSVAIGAGILAELAVRLCDEGMPAKQIAARLEEERNNIRLIAMLDTLEYLRRGGRISRTAAFAGSMLSIKPVVCIEDGAVGILGKARGSRQGNNLLIKEIELSGGVDFDKPLLLGYTGLTDALLQKYIKDSTALWQGNVEKLDYTIIGSGVGTHVGPGAIAVAFFKK